MKLKVFITAGEDSGFVAQVAALKGCWSQGVTREDALANAREAIEAWLETEQDKDERGGNSRGDGTDHSVTPGGRLDYIGLLIVTITAIRCASCPN